MTKGRNIPAAIMLVYFCVCSSASAERHSLQGLIELQQSALNALEKKLAGRNPYMQWAAAQKALENVSEAAGNVARRSLSIEQEREQLAVEKQKLAAEQGALLREVQDLRRSNRDLAETNEKLTRGNRQLLAKNEHLASRHGFYWIAFYSALGLAFLGFGGLLMRIPNSRLERKLKQLEITELETKLKKEAARSRAEEIRSQRLARPMAERRAPRPEPTSTEPEAASSGAKDAPARESTPAKRPATMDKTSAEKPGGLRERAATRAPSEHEPNKERTRKEPKKKKKKS